MKKKCLDIIGMNLVAPVKVWLNSIQNKSAVVKKNDRTKINRWSDRCQSKKKDIQKYSFDMRFFKLQT